MSLTALHEDSQVPCVTNTVPAHLSFSGRCEASMVAKVQFLSKATLHPTCFNLVVLWALTDGLYRHGHSAEETVLRE